MAADRSAKIAAKTPAVGLLRLKLRPHLSVNANEPPAQDQYVSESVQDASRAPSPPPSLPDVSAEDATSPLLPEPVGLLASSQRPLDKTALCTICLLLVRPRRAHLI